MALLFVDSTYDLTLGLLKEESHWSHFQTYQGQKVSVKLQKEIFEVGGQHSVKARNLQGIVTVAGPGFYTGIRLSEGLGDIFKFFGTPIYSFYSYFLPCWVGVEEGVWFTKAYRGEYFLHEWQGERHSSRLFSSKELNMDLFAGKRVFIHSLSSMDELSLSLISEYETTIELLRSNPQILTKITKENLKEESFYFRAPEDEFRVAP